MEGETEQRNRGCHEEQRGTNSAPFSYAGNREFHSPELLAGQSVSRRRPRLDAGNVADDPTTSSSSSVSAESGDSTVTTDGNNQREGRREGRSSAAADGPVDAVISMVLGGCIRCHMYVMIHRENLRCPRCYSSAVVNFFHQ